jgi:antitoxin component YwqK of YwqJK toxin-antitoxin module
MLLKYASCFLLAITIFLTAISQPEKTKIYVDYEGKPSVSSHVQYYLETYKTNADDQYWQRKMYYNDTTEGIVACVGKSKDLQGQIKEGIFVNYRKSGAKESEGNYLNNKKEGEWKEWNKLGELSAVNHFKNGKMVGRNISWFDNKKINDSTMLDENGNGKSFSFFDNGANESEGNYASGDKTGLWVYYHKYIKNQKSMEVIYEKDSALTYNCFDESGERQKKNCVFEREADFKGGEAAWRKYLVKKLTAGADNFQKYLRPGELYTVIIKFVVGKDGDIEDVTIEKRGKAALDAMAFEIIQDSPAWIPAMQYNRPVRAYRRQPISFRGPE